MNSKSSSLLGSTPTSPPSPPRGAARSYLAGGRGTGSTPFKPVAGLTVRLPVVTETVKIRSIPERFPMIRLHLRANTIRCKHRAEKRCDSMGFAAIRHDSGVKFANGSGGLI